MANIATIAFGPGQPPSQQSPAVLRRVPGPHDGVPLPVGPPREEPLAAGVPVPHLPGLPQQGGLPHVQASPGAAAGDRQVRAQGQRRGHLRWHGTVAVFDQVTHATASMILFLFQIKTFIWH